MGDKDMGYDNEFRITFRAVAQNEAFSRTAAAAFLIPLNPTVSELTDVKTAVSEAVTNAIIHGYGGEGGEVELRCATSGREVFVEVRDCGAGIEDVPKAREPLFTTRPEEERSGMGFTVMETFMDEVEVSSEPGKGTTVRLRKKLV
jgi:stage II sporulation protein AB (anti-sigma F factor)